MEGFILKFMEFGPIHQVGIWDRAEAASESGTKGTGVPAKHCVEC